MLDEPLAAADPASREKIIDTILNNFNEDSSILLSTHLVRDMERIFDEVLFINQGSIMLHSNVETLRAEQENH